MSEEQTVKVTGVVEITPELMGEVMALLGMFGTSVSNMLEQMLKGNWIDDHGHPVIRNTAMMALGEVMEHAIEFRNRIITSAMENPIEAKEEQEVMH